MVEVVGLDEHGGRGIKYIMLIYFNNEVKRTY